MQAWITYYKAKYSINFCFGHVYLCVSMCECESVCVCVVLLGHNAKYTVKYIGFSQSQSKMFASSCPSPASSRGLFHIQQSVFMPEISTSMETFLSGVCFLLALLMNTGSL